MAHLDDQDHNMDKSSWRMACISLIVERVRHKIIKLEALMTKWYVVAFHRLEASKFRLL